MSEDDAKAMEELFQLMRDGWYFAITGADNLYFEAAITRPEWEDPANRPAGGVPFARGSTLAEAVGHCLEKLRGA